MYKKKYRLDLMYILCVALLFVIQIAYAHSYIVYATAMIGLIVFSAYYLIKNIKKFPRFCTFVCLYNVIISFVIGIMNGGFEDALMAGASMMLPLAFASYHMVTTKIEKGCWIIAIGLFVVDFLKPYISVLDEMNMNGYSFMMFMGFTTVFILIQMKKNVWGLIMLLGVLYILSDSGSRNAFVIGIIIVVISLLPHKVLTNAIVYRVLYAISLLYQVFSEAWMEFANNNTYWSNLFTNIVDRFFNKDWGLESRVEILVDVSGFIWKQDLLRILFGNGNAFIHAHNGFYQALYMYGIVGTALIFALHVVVFEMAFYVMKREKNGLVMGCVLGTCGILLIQGADVFLWGTKTCSVVPFLLLGIIIRAYMEKRIEESIKGDTMNVLKGYIQEE